MDRKARSAGIWRSLYPLDPDFDSLEIHTSAAPPVKRHPPRRCVCGEPIAGQANKRLCADCAGIPARFRKEVHKP